VKLGEVFWVELEAQTGHAQRGRRPAIILQTSAAVPTVLVVPLTTQLDALRFPCTVLIEPDPEIGLRRPSVALIFQLTAIDRRYLIKSAGQVPQRVLEEIFSALDELTGR
jgi:mRNA-degrading endonuclease toxin of MazEF toxin-antitoxin module